jgi:hypothetical protein
VLARSYRDDVEAVRVRLSAKQAALLEGRSARALAAATAATTHARGGGAAAAGRCGAAGGAAARQGQQASAAATRTAHSLASHPTATAVAVMNTRRRATRVVHHTTLVT